MVNGFASHGFTAAWLLHGFTCSDVDVIEFVVVFLFFALRR